MNNLNYGPLISGVKGREDLHEKTMLWVVMGVYYGYKPYDIIQFYKRTSKGIPAPSDTALSGTGYITVSVCDEFCTNKQDVLNYIKNHRYCPRPFPETLRAQDDIDNANILLEMDAEFRVQVYSIIEAL